MRFLIGIVLIGALVGGLLFLFPHAVDGEQDRLSIITYSLLLIPVLGSAAFLRGARLKQSLRDIAAWVAVALLLVLAYSYRDALLGTRLGAELMPSRPRVLADGSITVRAAEGGHFYLDAKVNGAPVRFMVDTGATDIVLSPADARRAGFNPERLKYTRRYQTANGVVGGAPVVIGHLEAGGVVLTQLPASVNQAEMSGSLLGLTYLRAFKSYRVEGDSLTLIPYK